MAKAYGATVILHTDHAAKKLLPWIDGLLDASEKHFAETGKPLYSSHMIDLSEESIEENIEICKTYLERMSKMGMTLEIELGITGGEEDGVDNSDVDSSKLYTQPSEVAFAYEELMKVSPRFTIAVAFTEGTRDYMLAKKDYLMKQIGNPDGEDVPNKKYYDPRLWMREGEKTFVTRLEQAFADLNNVNTL